MQGYLGSVAFVLVVSFPVIVYNEITRANCYTAYVTMWFKQVNIS